jgi:predicted metal-binding protein
MHLKEKIERLVREKTKVVHFGVCTKSQKDDEECTQITVIARMIEEAGISTVRGTH